MFHKNQHWELLNLHNMMIIHTHTLFLIYIPALGQSTHCLCRISGGLHCDLSLCIYWSYLLFYEETHTVTMETTA